MGDYFKQDRVRTEEHSGRIPSMTIPEKNGKESAFINYHKSKNDLTAVIRNQIKGILKDFKNGEVGFLWNPGKKYSEEDSGHVLIGPITNYKLRNVNTGKISNILNEDLIEYASIQSITKDELLCNIPNGNQIIISFNNDSEAVNRDKVYFSELELKL